MPVYKINLPLTTRENVEQVAFILQMLAPHMGPMGFTISSPSIGTGGDAGKIRLNISKTLTAAELAHLGLSI